MPITITEVVALDIRFPTSDSLDGSDAMNPDPDYSAAYVILKTDDATVRKVTGSPSRSGVATSCASRRSRPSRRWSSGARSTRSTPTRGRSGTRSSATDSCAGSARRRASSTWPPPPSSTPSGICCAKVEGKPLWKLLVDLSPEELVACVDVPLHHRCAHAGRGAGHPARGRCRAGRRARRRCAPKAIPAYTTSAGWLGYSDDKVRRRAGRRRRRVAALQDQGRRATWPTTSAACAIVREEIGDDRLLMVDANQVWDVDEAIDWMRALAPFDPWWIEEPTSPDDILGHARDRARRGRSDSRRHRRARPQPRDVQAVLPGRRDRRLPDRRLPPRRGQRGARGAAAGREVRRAGLPPRRRRRAVRVRPAPRDVRLHRRERARWRTASSSTWITCTSTSSTPAVVRRRPLRRPDRAGLQHHDATGFPPPLRLSGWRSVGTAHGVWSTPGERSARGQGQPDHRGRVGHRPGLGALVRGRGIAASRSRTSTRRPPRRRRVASPRTVATRRTFAST